MKKWLIVLSIIFGTSAVTAAVAGGNAIFNTKETVYTDRGEQALNKAALSHIYINSVIPVEVYPTTGEPKVEYNQKAADFIKNFPKYELSVTEREGSTYIDLTQTETSLWIGHAKNDAYLTLYLPEGTIERLDIKSRASAGGYTQRNHMINLKNIHVKDLSMNLYQRVTIDLDGNYQKVSIDTNSWQSTLNMVSKTPATVRVNGSIEQNLTGQFEKINIESCDDDMTINSQTPARVDIKNSDGVNIDLKGQYNQVMIDGYSQIINLDSSVECRLNIYGGENILYAKAPFKMIELNGYDSTMEVQTTTVPRSIRMTEKMNSKVKLILPSNIPGFTVSSHLEGIEVADGNVEETNRMLFSQVRSDFDMSANGSYSIQYGNGLTKIEVPNILNEEFQLDVIDGGYDVALS